MNYKAMAPQSAESAAEMLTTKEAASVLGLTEKTLVNWRGRGGGPRWIKVGLRAVRYRRDDVTAFLVACEKAA